MKPQATTNKQYDNRRQINVFHIFKHMTSVGICDIYTVMLHLCANYIGIKQYFKETTFITEFSNMHITLIKKVGIFYFPSVHRVQMKVKKQTWKSIAAWNASNANRTRRSRLSLWTSLSYSFCRCVTLWT